MLTLLASYSLTLCSEVMEIRRRPLQISNELEKYSDCVGFALNRSLIMEHELATLGC